MSKEYQIQPLVDYDALLHDQDTQINLPCMSLKMKGIVDDRSNLALRADILLVYTFEITINLI